MVEDQIRFVDYADYVEKVFSCRKCRGRDEMRERDFNSEIQNCPPQVVDGPDKIDILVVSLNPRLHVGKRVPETLVEYQAQEKTYEKPQFDHWEGKRYVAAVQRALPSGYNWWNTTDKTVGNTRLCKCPTRDWNGKFTWAAELCVNRFFKSEIELLQPRVLLVVGKSEWPTVLRLLEIRLPSGEEPHLCQAVVRGVPNPIPTVVAKHLTRASNEYCARVKGLLEQAIVNPRGQAQSATQG